LEIGVIVDADAPRQADPGIAEFGGDAAAEQLYDELLARSFAVAMVAPSIRAGGSWTAIHGDLATCASVAVHKLRSARRPPASTLSRMLWPHGTEPCPTHPWWSTPLGALLAAGGAPGETSRNATTAAGRPSPASAEAEGPGPASHAPQRAADRSGASPRSPARSSPQVDGGGGAAD
jgi:hypothetical protein